MQVTRIAWLNGALALAWIAACADATEPRKPDELAAGGSAGGDAGAAAAAGVPPGENASGAPSIDAEGGESGAGRYAAGGAPAGAAGDAADPAHGGAGGEPEPTAWSGAIGNLCGAEDRRSRWLVMSPKRSSCEARAEALTADSGDFIRAELPVDEREPWTVTNLEARRCSAGRCRDGVLALVPAANGDGASGTFNLSIAGEPTLAGTLVTADCAWDDHVAATAPLEPGVRGLSLRALAVFQGVKVPIMERGVALSPNRAPVIADRAALFRAYAAPENEWRPRPVLARLTLSNADELTTFEDTLTLERASDDAELDSTFNFDVPAAFVRPQTRYSLELFETERCAAPGERLPGRFPEAGTAELEPKPVGGLIVEVLPLRIQASAGTLVADTSDRQVARLRTALLGMFPISNVELRVRAPVESSATNALEALDQVASIRDEENPGRRVSYYGLFRFTDTLEEYCAGTCVLGESVIGQAEDARACVAVGVGYTGDAAVRTFVHELGHVYGRPHSPCGVPGDADYPDSGGRIGSFGYDRESKVLFSPSVADFMGYCEPVWVSDHTFGRLASFVQAVNTDLDVASLRRDTRARFRTILLDRGVPPSLGRARDVAGAPPGIAEPAVAFTRDGAGTALTAYRSTLADVGGALVYVPEPVAQNWASIRLQTGELVQLDR